MENSIEENAGTDSLKVFHHMVTAVKNDGEVGLAYMKSVEIEKRIREEGREGKCSGILDGLSFCKQRHEGVLGKERVCNEPSRNFCRKKRSRGRQNNIFFIISP
jgi:hypothetical protein